MNKHFLRFTFFLLMFLTLPLTATAQVVDIPDPNLRAAVEKTLGKASDATITTADMAALTSLTARESNISDLTGLEHATSLTRLDLRDNIISDISALAELTNLRRLYLSDNSVSDLSPLVGLTNLTTLYLQRNNISGISAVTRLTNLTELPLDGNNITDISPIVGLTNLTYLDLDGNRVSDISVVAALTSLTRLELGGLGITDISFLAGLTQLRMLWLWGNLISDLSPLGGLTNLTSLSLGSNALSDIAVVARLTNLTKLRIQHNGITDLSPLVANTGLGKGDEVDVRGNRLSDQSLFTHIPILQSRGVTVDFDDRAPTPSINSNGTVPLVYFIPSDRDPRSDQVIALRALIKEAHRFYADQMDKHGFGRRTFNFESDEHGDPLVHQIHGKFTEHYYNFSDQGNPETLIWKEIVAYFENLHDVYFVAIDSSRNIIGANAGGLGSTSFFTGDKHAYGFVPVDSSGGFALRHREITPGEQMIGGLAIIPAFNIGFHQLGATLHELGHAFGIQHDVREGLRSGDVMAFGKQNRLSKCAAEWLSVSRFFHTKSTFLNELGEIQLLSMRTYNQDTISFRFKVTDSDGLHQAQLLVPTILEDPQWVGWGPFRLFDCKRLNGKTGTVETVVRRAELVDRITLQIIDVGGTITWATFPIQLDEVEHPQNTLDVNSDGMVNILDLIPFVSRFGQRGQDSADVNEDGIVDTIDVLLVASLISSLPPQVVGTFTSADVQKWLTDAKQLEVENENLQKGIVLLEHLLTEITLSLNPMEVATGQLQAVFVGHTDNVRSVAFSPDGQTLASGSWDRTIRLWNPHTRQHKNTLIRDTNQVMTVTFSLDGQTLVSGSWGGRIRLWNPHTGEHKRAFTAHRDGVVSVVFSPDGQTLASGGDDGIVRLWSATTWQVERTLTGHTGVVEVAVFSPDGAILASGSLDGTIRLWNPNTGNHIRTLPATSPVNRLAFSPDGDTLASGSLDSTIRLWNPNTGKLKRTLPNQGGWENAVAFSPDGQTIVIGNRGISLWDTDTEQYKIPLAGDVGNALSVVFSPDGTMLASGSADHLVRLWDFNPSDYENFVVEIPDPNLHAAIAEALGKNAREPITAAEIATLTRLEAKNANISNLTGLEHATNLTELFLGDEYVEAEDRWMNSNSVKDLSPLAGLTSLIRLGLRNNNISNILAIAGLTNLRLLDLNNNNISDISALEGLTNLTWLNLWYNNISDISALVDLTSLKELSLGGNTISDISVLTGLTQLERLELWGNSTTDISSVAGLTNLTRLGLRNNNISDLSPLVANTGLGEGDEVYVQGNPLSYQSIHTYILALQSRGVTVEFDADGTRPPDVNGDGEIDVLDLIVIAQSFGTTKGDVNGDGTTDILDLTLVSQAFRIE